ncbi:23S rRNA (guanosine(2251)-2'-O)-methyltransferase RlmB [Futiania mangrovi]|uniref:23S rRNA (Guanosine(2251)-2'-O)-methyltransferase RlmB n=1 Tax=Futiania mangrovi TaxID=2959716 RepID=A0A9J6PBP1_9PROT|nr:23S rRNA (guanosine(2251)-2'-O)-methyltransferase RlmB [Futiania mangrovii]MCP1335168.1 23S rRNA (guanosine(2251)-2'-O)-methyltransferase RlmB [Futiania mangrovii]
MRPKKVSRRDIRSHAARHGPKGPQRPAGHGGWIWGTHAVLAALANPARRVRRIAGTPAMLDQAAPHLAADHPKPESMEARDLDRLLGPGTVHQGLAIEAADLPSVALSDIARREGPVLVLDQVTDPHNVGAILRSAAAFGVAGVVMQERHSPPLFGALAKAASGAAETVAIARETNLARALEELADLGYWRIGLAGGSSARLDTVEMGARVALVLGAEGTGLRRLTAETCDLLARIPMSEAMESLNVSNAAAIALYDLFRRSHPAAGTGP